MPQLPRLKILQIVRDFYLPESQEVGYCNFPDYLWAPLPNGGSRKWISKTEYIENSATWDRQKEVTAHATELVIKHKLHASCTEYQSEDDVPCFRMDIVSTIICIAEEQGGKYRVMIKGSE